MISVLMCVYNEKIKWIKEAVESILLQTYDNLEFIIVVDNPSLPSDIKEYLKEIEGNDKRVLLCWNAMNRGLAMSLNIGLSRARGEYIARMDSDDISSINRLEREVRFLEKNKFDMITSNKINIDEDSNFISYDNPITKDPNKHLVYGNMIIHSSILIKKEVIDKMSGYRDMMNSEDLDLWLRLVDAGYKIGVLNEYLLEYRIRGNSASIARQLEQYYVMKYIVKLKKERGKKGKDSFSKEGLQNYLKQKKITEEKKNKFAKANNCIERAVDKLNSKKIIQCIILIIKSAFYYQELSKNVVLCYLQIKIR